MCVSDRKSSLRDCIPPWQTCDYSLEQFGPSDTCIWILYLEISVNQPDVLLFIIKPCITSRSCMHCVSSQKSKSLVKYKHKNEYYKIPNRSCKENLQM